MTNRLFTILSGRHWLLASLILVGAVAAAFGPRWLFGPTVQAYAVVRNELLQTVVATGRVETPQRVDVGTKVTGRVSRVPVAEGQTVRRGQNLIELDDREERAVVAQARAAAEQARAKLRQLREVGLPAAQQSLVQAQANRLQAQRNYERSQELNARGFIGKSQLDDAQRNLDVAETQVQSAQLQVVSNAPAGSDYALAQTALQQAEANLQLAQAKLENMLIKAPLDGTLIARSVESGDVVQPGKALMVLAPAGETQLVVQIDEKNLAKLKPGQKALASADAYPQHRFDAELLYINPGIDAQRGSVEVKLRVPAAPDYLRQDMTVSVDIEVARRADTLVLPSEAVRDAGGREPWVLVARDGRTQRQNVKLGLRGDGRTEILDGLQAGELAIPATDGTIGAGQRVRASVGESKGQ